MDNDDAIDCEISVSKDGQKIRLNIQTKKQGNISLTLPVFIMESIMYKGLQEAISYAKELQERAERRTNKGNPLLN